MKCKNCGAELLSGVRFCFECGADVSSSDQVICKNCGAENESGAKYCKECGFSLLEQGSNQPTANEPLYKVVYPSSHGQVSSSSSPNSQGTYPAMTSEEKLFSEEKKEPGKSTATGKETADPVQNPADSTSYTTPNAKDSSNQNDTFSQKAKQQALTFWDNQDLLGKATTVVALLGVLFLLIALLAGKSGAILISILQIAAAVVANLLNSGKIKTDKKWLKPTLLVVSALLILSYFSGLSQGKSSTSDDRNASANTGSNGSHSPAVTTVPKTHDLYLDLTSDINLFFDTYDMEIYLDQDEIGIVSNGKLFTKLVEVPEGKHELYVYKSGDHSIKATKTLSVSGPTTFTATILHNSSSIQFKDSSISDNINGAQITVAQVEGMVLAEAEKQLKALGFVNVTAHADGSIWDKDNWIVMRQSIAAGSVADKNDTIQLECTSLDLYFNDNYVGKNVTEIQELAASAGFSVKFEDRSGNAMENKLASMDSSSKNAWVATKARQYGGADKTAIVTIETHTKEPETTILPSTEAPVETEAASTEDVSHMQSPSSDKPTMPVMAGSSLETILEASKKFGMKRAFSDEDFGHGTKICTLENGSGGLTLDIVYSATTKEILSASIVTFNTLSTSNEQKSFITSMAGYLCPQSDKNDVENWVKASIGKGRETTISGFSYELSTGNVGNLCYDAGMQNWEEWVSAFD
ncbi:MAG: zinc-ribbon domain-containing protein [Oscillospiraceae bacterium]|nr:zinc-ribbon domain-containing protein [Oscillospiraceae bacterium]